MAHVELPQEELEPLIQSMKKVFDPLIRAIPVSYTHLRAHET